MLEFTILLLSIIHSIFGIGLLAIGTPLLLLLNYDFLIILKILLPCSILISIFQIIDTKNLSSKDKKLICISLPYVFLGSFIIYYFSSKINFKLAIGFSILSILFLKIFLKEKLRSLIKNNKTILISFTGFFHGLTNTGGSLISLIFQDLKKNKHEIKACIAYTYFFYALIQYCLLTFFLKKILLDYDSFKLSLFVCVGYFLGNKIFKKLKLNYFLNILNFIVLLSGIYLIFSELKIIFVLTL
jgi:uncharacterized membrane protein YfcA